jgi:predicted nucleotidyltransferase
MRVTRHIAPQKADPFGQGLLRDTLEGLLCEREKENEMAVDALLQIRRREHEALLQQALRVLQADQRIIAAWLFGSVGRHTSDVFSDLDLWVIVRDESIETMSAQRQSYAAQLDRPVLLLESPGNAPAGGAYLMALYPGQAGVHQVDWYWQRHSDASLPGHAMLLFDRGGIPQDTRQEQLDPAGTPPPFTQQEQAEQATQLGAFFWVMSNIAVKSVLRHQAWTTISHLEGLRGLVDRMKRLIGLSTVQEGQEEWRTTLLPPVQRAEQMAMLREIAQEMEQLTSAIELIGGQVPSRAIPYVYDFFDLADALIQQEENRAGMP